ncbi:MAG: periplasmic heavy metal sensor [Betaproteobacteria bacterium]
MTTRLSPHRALAFAAAALFTLGLSSAQAQPGGFGHGPGGGPGGGPGAGSPMGHGFGIEQTLETLKGKLALNTLQQKLWDAAVGQGSANRDSGRALMLKVRDAMRAELTKPDPNLGSVAAIADDAEQQGRTLRRQVRDQWLQLYATFTPEQKAIVREALQQKMDSMESFRARMGRRFSGG